MSKVTTVHVSAAVRLNKNYQSFDASAGITLELEEGEEPEAVLLEWEPRLRKFCREAARASMKEAGRCSSTASAAMPVTT